MKLWCAIGAAMLASTGAASARDAVDALDRRGVATIQDAIAALNRRHAAGAPSPALEVDPGQWFGPDAYPPAARRAGEQGRTVVALAVTRAGRVNGCDVVSSSGSASLDRRTCEIATARLTFRPVRNGRGRAQPSHYTLPVRWVLPTPLDAQPVVGAR